MCVSLPSCSGTHRRSVPRLCGFCLEHFAFFTFITTVDGGNLAPFRVPKIPLLAFRATF